ncbi:unnamed protein product [Prunus armeniaca]
MEDESLQAIIWGQKSIILTSVPDNLAAYSSSHPNPTGAAIGPLPGEMQTTWKCIKMLGVHSVEFDAWWKARFQGLPASSTVLKILFDGWDSWVVHAGEETHKFMVHTIKDINAQFIEDPSLTENIGGQTVQVGEVIGKSTIILFLLSFPAGLTSDFVCFLRSHFCHCCWGFGASFWDEEDETLAEQTSIKATPSVIRKRKETASVHDSAAQPVTSAESPHPPLTKSKRLRKRIVVEYVAMEESAAAPTNTSGTRRRRRCPFQGEEQRVGRRDEPLFHHYMYFGDSREQHEEEAQRAEPTSLELALSDDEEAEHSATAQMPMEQSKLSVLEQKEQADVLVAATEPEVEASATVPGLVVEVPRTTGVLGVMTSPLKPPIVVMPIHSLLASSSTASYADLLLAKPSPRQWRLWKD